MVAPLIPLKLLTPPVSLRLPRVVNAAGAARPALMLFLELPMPLVPLELPETPVLLELSVSPVSLVLHTPPVPLALLLLPVLL